MPKIGIRSKLEFICFMLFILNSDINKFSLKNIEIYKTSLKFVLWIFRI